MGEVGKPPNHQVKVDNWSIFFLQRLHHFFKKDYHCDLTLLFSTMNTVKSIKVHKLVLHACTDYFETMQVTNDSKFGECLQLSDEMHPDVVIPIISFMYTGKLEFPANLQTRLYEAAIKLRMTILTKLLDAQAKQTSTTPVATQVEENSSKTSGLQYNVVEPVGNTDNSQPSQESYTPSVQVMEIMSNMSVTPTAKNVEEPPIVTLSPIPAVPQQKTATVSDSNVFNRSKGFDALKSNNTTPLKTKAYRKDTSAFQTESTPKTKIVDLTLPPTLPGRKLPIWKRKIPLTGSHFSTENTSEIRGVEKIVHETPRPTRFEWDEDLNDPTVLRPVEEAMRVLSHDATTEIHHPIILDGYVSNAERNESNNNSSDSVKRSSPSSPSSPDSPPYKRSRTDLQDMKEYGKQQQLRNEILCSEDNSEDGMDPDDLYGSCDEDSQDLLGSQSSINPSAPKPILKSFSKPEPAPASKRVRFSFEGKENNKKTNDLTALVKKPGAVLTKQKIVVPMNVNQIRTGGQHVKIVSEVLKKYPNLTKRENVKLKVVSKIPAAVPPTVQHAVEGDAGSGNKSVSSHVSYIYLMNENPNQISNVQVLSNEKDKEFDVENRTGPWICSSCDPDNPIEFDTYYNYRRHLVDVHEMKIDARICEYCGLRSSKRNHLLYHLYTKHRINPPAHVSFPKCSECDYIALSDALLLKHRLVHEAKEMLTCFVCNVVFRSLASMQIHLQSAWHKKRMSEVPIAVPNYPCPFCESQFVGGNELRDHIEEHHQTQRAMREGKQIYRCPYCEALFADGDQLGKHIVSTHWGKNNRPSSQGANKDVHEQSEHELQYAEETSKENEFTNTESGDIQEATTLESLNNVASGIVTSLNLVGNEQNVVYYEQQTDHQDIGREATVMTGEECKDFIIPGSVEEIESGGSYQRTDQSEDAISVDNDDSNSRTSNIEEVNPTSCSDHDYSEPQSDDSIRQVIPVQQISSNYQGAPIIQQILPEQQLVFTSQPSVVFQSPQINIPQRVLLAPGNVVFSQISHLPQVIPQTRIILSNQIIQQPTSILQDSGSTIVFTNPELPTQEMDNVETVSYPHVESTEIEDSKDDENTKEHIVTAEVSDQVIMDEGSGVEDLGQQESRNDSDDRSLVLNELIEESGLKVNTEATSILSNRPKQKPIIVGSETAKIVDDWDEANEGTQSVENRNVGPSRPEFF